MQNIFCLNFESVIYTLELRHNPNIIPFAEEIEELTGRLKASRQRVADLERSFTTASTSSQKHEQVHSQLMLCVIAYKC